MSSSFASAAPAEELEKLLHRQLEHEIEDMPVLNGAGRLLGAINLTRVLRELAGVEGSQSR